MTFRTAYGYTHSENGWPMVNRDGCVLGLVGRIPHTNTAPIRSGDAATILNAWIVYYHTKIEPIASPVWGWSATNDVANSNHLSGTAVDINAPRYPWGSRTMPAGRRALVRRGLAEFGGAVFWGADWSRADEMHYQLGAPPNHPIIRDMAQRLNNGHLGIYAAGPSTPVTPVVRYTVRAGDTLNVIAARHGTTVAQLVAWNRIPNPDRIYVGQVLRVR